MLRCVVAVFVYTPCFGSPALNSFLVAISCLCSAAYLIFRYGENVSPTAIFLWPIHWLGHPNKVYSHYTGMYTGIPEELSFNLKTKSLLIDTRNYVVKVQASRKHSSSIYCTIGNYSNKLAFKHFLILENIYTM